MIHKSRRFSIKPVTLEEIAGDMTSTSWCLCNGYSVQHGDSTFLVLNDSFNEDSLQEYAVCHVLQHVGTVYRVEQQESLTFSWIGSERLPDELKNAFEYRGWLGQPFTVNTDHYQQHHCGLCA